LSEIVEIIAQRTGMSNQEAYLRLVHDVLIQKEHLRKPHDALGRDGLDCQNFFLDFINEAAGYSEKHYEESRLTTEELI
jgi:hypothetical protein